MKVGIWMDKREARIVVIERDHEQMIVVESDVEDYHPKGGSGTKVKGGPQDVVQDSKYTKREKHQMKSYFNRIVELLPEFNALIIFGPSQTGQKFADALSDHHKKLDDKLKGVEIADSMTDNQIKAWVRDYYNKN